MTTVCVPTTIDGEIDPRWGRAHRVAVAEVVDGVIQDWNETTVAWDVHHDDGAEGAHHARVARFLRDNGVVAIVVGHVGPGMQRMLQTMDIQVITGQAGNARAAVQASFGSGERDPSSA